MKKKGSFPTVFSKNSGELLQLRSAAKSTVDRFGPLLHNTIWPARVGVTQREPRWFRTEMSKMMRGVDLNESPLPGGMVTITLSKETIQRGRPDLARSLLASSPPPRRTASPPSPAVAAAAPPRTAAAAAAAGAAAVQQQ